MWLSENPASAARRPGVSTQFRSVSVAGGHNVLDRHNLQRPLGGSRNLLYFGPAFSVLNRPIGRNSPPPSSVSLTRLRLCAHIAIFSKVAAGCAVDWRSRSDVDRTIIDCSVFGPAAKPITLFGVAILTFQSPAVARGRQLDLISRSSPDEATDTGPRFLAVR